MAAAPKVRSGRFSGTLIALLVFAAGFGIAFFAGTQMFSSLSSKVARHEQILTKVTTENQKRDARMDRLDKTIQQASKAVQATNAELDRTASRLSEMQNGVARSQQEIRDMGARLSRDEHAAERAAGIPQQAPAAAPPQQ